MNLTKKQEAFALAVITEKTGADAYRKAYEPKNMSAKTIHEEASKLLAMPKIAARVAELRAPALAAAGMSAERTLTEVARVSYVDPRRFYHKDGSMKAPGEWDDDMAAAVASVEAIPVVLHGLADDELDPQPHGGALARKRNPKIGYTYKIKFWDKNAGLEKSMKHLGLYEKDNAQSREGLVLRVEQAKPVTP